MHHTHSTFLSSIIGSRRTLERIFLFKTLSMSIRLMIFSPKVYKEIVLSVLINFYTVGKRSDERGCSKRRHLCTQMEILWSEWEYFGLLGNTIILIYCSLVSSQRIEAIRVKVKDIGKISLTQWCQWNIQISYYSDIGRYKLFFLSYKIVSHRTYFILKRSSKCFCVIFFSN